LPIWAWLPVSLLNRVDLPVLGMPSTAIVAGLLAMELAGELAVDLEDDLAGERSGETL
jgi:hypothetical protein